jgi:hypothetical protein
MFWFGRPTGYIFTYLTRVPKCIGYNGESHNLGGTAPAGLDVYFLGDATQPVDIVLSCKMRSHQKTPVQWVGNFIIRASIENLAECSTKELLEMYNKNKSPPAAKTFSKNILKVINANLGLIESVENWIANIIKNIPLNSESLPNRYPRQIRESTLRKPCKITKGMLFVEYDFRLIGRTQNIYKIENTYINLLEDAFETNRDIVIYNTFNNILPNIKKQAHRRKL